MKNAKHKSSQYIHSFWPDLNVKSGCLCIGDQIALPHAIKYAYIDLIRSSHPGSWGMNGMAIRACRPFMNGNLLTKTAERASK